MSYEINEVVIIDGNRNVVNAGVGTFSKVSSTTLEVGSSGIDITTILDEDDLVSNSATALPTQQSVKAYADANEAHIDNLATLSGLAKDSTHLGTFIGSTIADSSTVKAALQALESAHEEVDANANDLITLSGVAENSTTLGTFTGGTIADSSTIKAALQAVETAHEEVDANANDLITLSGVAENSTTLGTFTGGTIADSSTVKAALQALETAHEVTDGNADDLITLSGVAENATDLGTFTGTTISDSSTVKAALQDLETAVDSALSGSAVAVSVAVTTRAVDATHYLTFVTDDNSASAQESLYTDAGVQYNPSSNILTVGEVVITGDLTVNGTQTVLDTTTLTVEDKNITLGVTTSPTDATADGGGFTLKGSTDKTFNWVNATDAFTASEHIDMASGKEYRIANASVLSATTLGSGVVNSSLTSVGTLTSLNVSGNLDIDGTTELDGLNVDGSTTLDATTIAGDLNHGSGNIIGDGSTNISGINTVTASGKMYALSFTTTSDAALKENVAEIEDAVAKVEAIRGVTFDWKDGSGSTAGVIAQEVEAVLPSIIDQGEHKRVDYNGLIGLLIEAVKELSAEVKELKAK